MYKKILYIVGPSGSGKSTLSDCLVNSYNYSRIRTTTSRNPRNESEFFNTNFISREQFKELIDKDAFIEYAVYAGNYYGTLKSDISHDKVSSLFACKVIEFNGLLQILESGYHEKHWIDYHIVYIHPVFEGYEDCLKSRKDWEKRKEEDKEIKTELFSLLNSSLKDKKCKCSVLINNGSIMDLVARANSMCIFKGNYSELCHHILKLPNSVYIDNDSMDKICDVIFVDDKVSSISNHLYLHSDERFRPVSFFIEVFKDYLSYYDDECVVFHLSNVGLTVKVSY